MSIKFVSQITRSSMADNELSGGKKVEFSEIDEAVIPSRDNGLRG